MRGPVIEKRGPGLFEKANYYEAAPELNVYSWSPSEDPNDGTPATQVHMHFGTAPGLVGVMRFKSPRSLDAVIDALLAHREDVWGKR